MVLSEFWHDRGGRRRINSGDPKIYEYAISGCFLGLCLICAALAGLSKSSNYVMTLMINGKLLKIRLSSHPVVAVMIEACGIQPPPPHSNKSVTTCRGDEITFTSHRSIDRPHIIA